VSNLRAINVTPHVAQNDSVTSTGKRRRSAIDGRTTRHQGYGIWQSCRAMTVKDDTAVARPSLIEMTVRYTRISQRRFSGLWRS